MASTGDAPPPPPQPEEITPSVLHRLATSPIASDNLLLLTIIRDTPDVYIDITSDLHGLFTRSLISDTDASLQSAARVTYIALAGHVGRMGDAATTNTLFAPFTRNLIAHIQDLPTERDDAINTLVLLTNLASALPQAVLPNLAAIVTLCNEIVHSDATQELRGKALDLLVTISNTAPESIPDRCLPLIVDAFMTTLCRVSEKHSDWMSPEGRQSKELLRQVVSNLHERGVVGVILQTSSEFLQYDDDWSSRFAAVMASEVIGTTGRIQMVEQIVQQLTLALNDSDARVREVACKAMQKMSPHFSPTSSYLKQSLPLLITAMGKTSTIKVADAAAEVLLGIISSCPAFVLPYLDEMIARIASNFQRVAPMRYIDTWERQNLTQTQLRMVSALAVAAVVDGCHAASLLEQFGVELNQAPARIAYTAFERVYNGLVDSIKWLLPNKEVFLPAMDCLSHMSMVIGQGPFAKDAAFIFHAAAFRMDFLDEEDCQLLLQSLRRMCASLADHCAPFLPLLMPPLTRIARSHAHSSTKGSSYAVGIISELVTVLGVRFAPYAKDAARVFTDDLKSSGRGRPFYRLLSCIRDEGTASVRAIWEPYWAKLKGTISGATRSSCWRFIGSMAQCLEVLGSGGLTTIEVKEFGEKIKEVALKGMDNGCTEKVGDMIHTAEEALLEHINVLISHLFETCGPTSHTMIHDLLPILLTSMKNSSRALRLIARYTLHVPQLPYTVHHQLICPLVMQSLGSDDAVTRCEAAYALGNVAMAQYALWNDFIASSIIVLIKAIDRPDARSTKSSILATEAKMAAAAKIIKFCRDIDVTPLISRLVSWLDLQCVYNDEEDAAYVYDALTDLIEAGNVLVVGENKANWGRLLAIILKALDKNDFDDNEKERSVKRRLEKTVKALKESDKNFFAEFLRRIW